MSDLYDDPALAASYARTTAANVYNACYERPALRAAAGDVAGRDLLDAGCAAGEHAEWFAAHGARVVAVDASAAMVALARERLGVRARVERADLAAPLPFDDASFDLVVSSLTMHYLPEWLPALREFARVLRPGGWFVMSTHHPFITIGQVPEYFGVHRVEEAWTSFAPEPVRVRFYHRPFERILGDLQAAGFAIRAVREPQPVPEAAERDPAAAERLRREPVFLIVDAQRA
ncbi:SAM-dependent methyltransferase [Vulcanimicrobium alpinum]|uniref:SAM-dependent methyltransferase n=1 Tax=Vulcanimicrobium alpinum TaxID=3016050 RepID=A0AAN1XVW2_UNVUL|nr:class I SAM-dependent methyltransferase [Vulcanimicrobium alpinum]BDE06377.1 SAM-dependent methyltransferase [Vulcanimicrobium alpinum]